MALPQSAVSELLEAFRTTDGLDLVKESVRLVLQELIEAEAVEHFGARYERTEARTSERDGARAKVITTAGDVALRIPKSPLGRLVLPFDPCAAEADRPCAARGDHGGLRARCLHSQGG